MGEKGSPKEIKTELEHLAGINDGKTTEKIPINPILEKKKGKPYFGLVDEKHMPEPKTEEIKK